MHIEVENSINQDDSDYESLMYEMTFPQEEQNISKKVMQKIREALECEGL